MHQLPVLPKPAWLAAAAILALVALGPALGRGGGRRARTTALLNRCLLVALAAALWTAHAAQRRLDDRLPDELTGRDFSVRGWVDAFPFGTAERKTLSLRVEHAADPVVPGRLRLGWYDAPAELEAGASVELTVRLRAPRGLSNPGGFDYERWLLVEGYGATGYVRSGGIVPDRGWNARRWWLRTRLSAAKSIAAFAPDAAAAALVTALAIGERFGFTEEQWTALRQSGTSHLVAVSGMHVGLLALLVFVAVRAASLRLPAAAARYDLEAAAAASAVAAVGYAAFAGFAVPAQRSVVMILVALAVAASRRAVAPASGLAAGALAVIALDPFAVLAASFWMSFGAVALLLWLGSGVAVPARAAQRGRLERIRSHAASFTALQAAISIALVPVTVVFFREFSAVSPVVNLVAIPFFNLVLVPLTLAAVLASYAHVPGYAELIYAAGWLANGAWWAIDTAAAWPWSAFATAPPPLGVAALAIVGAAAAARAHPLPGRRLAWCALLPLVLPQQTRPAVGVAEVTMLDVGHGLAIIVETHSHRLLYDAGPRFASGYDSGEEVVVPVLRAKPYAGLDLVVVSHADNDHAGGVAAVLGAYPTAEVLKGPDVTDVAGRACEAGQRWTWDGVAFRVLHPPASFAARGNESSCVLRIATASGSLLITGDAEARAERLLAADPGVAADVVVVGHHGSATSSSSAFVRATGARLALVSAAHANRWGFPRPEVVRRWEAVGASIRVTGSAGALSFRLGDGPIRPAGERGRRHRYWRTDSRPVSGASDEGAL